MEPAQGLHSCCGEIVVPPGPQGPCGVVMGKGPESPFLCTPHAPSPAPTSVLWKLRFGEAWGPGAALWPTSGLSLLTPGSSLPSHWPSSHPALAASPVPLMGPRWSAPASLLALGGRDQGPCLGSGARSAGCCSSHPSPTFQSAGTAERGPGGSLAANQGENRAWGFRVSKAVLNLGSTYAL